jgi:hypothetical protein
MKIEEIHELTQIDPWFLHNIKQIIEMEEEISAEVRKCGSAEVKNNFRVYKLQTSSLFCRRQRIAFQTGDFQNS